MKFTSDDLAKLKVLKGVIAAGDYSIKGEAIVKVASLLQWLDSLDEKIKDALREPPMSIASAPKQLRDM